MPFCSLIRFYMQGSRGCFSLLERNILPVRLPVAVVTSTSFRPQISCPRTTYQTIFKSYRTCASSSVNLTMSTSPSRKSKSSVNPDILRNWDFRTYTVKDLEDECTQAIAHIQKLADDVVATTSLSYVAVLKPLLECLRLYGDENGTITSVFNTGLLVAESEEIRTACTRLKGLITDAFVNLEMRKDVYDKLVAYKNEVVTNRHYLSTEHKKCLSKLILNGRRNGLELSEDVQQKVKAIKKEMSDLELEFGKNYTEENTLLQFDENELQGMDAAFLANLKKDPETGKRIVSLKYPDYVPLSRKCTVPDTRRRMETAFNSRCTPRNSEILKKLILLRAEHASLLGYPTHAAYIQEILMAQNPAKVESFFKNIIPKLIAHLDVEKIEMLKLKEQECKDLGLEFDGKLNMWDISHYFHLMTEKKYSLDSDLLKQYFPLEVVLDGMLKIYQQILLLKFSVVPNAETWHSDVTLHRVEDIETGVTLGYFYLDLYPRTGKFSHACCSVIQQGCLDETGERMKTVAVLICNFPQSSADNPSLLGHDEVETMFHEFGHGMHAICSKAESPMYHGYLVERDFLEAPSQMLENWCYEKDSLRLMSKHYKTGAPLPDDLIDNLVKSKAKDGGLMTMRQIVYAMTDQRLHTMKHDAATFEPIETFKSTLNELMGLEITPGTDALASFWHMAGNYDARYYGYMWSNVYGEDMFQSVFQREGVLNPAAGKRYRRCILEPGGSLDGMEMLKSFLGREPSMTPFLRSKGLLKSD